MTAVTVYQGLVAAFREISGIQAILLGDPTTIQVSPALIIVYGSFDVLSQSSPPARNLNATSHEFGIRLAIKWGPENEQAEMQLLTLIGAIPAAIGADPRLGGRLPKGLAQISGAVTGYAEYSKDKFRIADYVCTVVEKEEAT